MKALIYVNPHKDPEGKCVNNLINNLKDFNVDYEFTNLDKQEQVDADALFVLGGDGTILAVVEYALHVNLPIIGINVGKLGFLTEFEQYDIKLAVELFSKNKLHLESRTVLTAEYENKHYIALNEIFVQRMYKEASGSIITLDVSLNGEKVDKIVGDGVIVSTPTGSTAYSLSAGGAILSLGTNVFQINPIAAHSISHRPIVYSSDTMCDVIMKSGEDAGLFVDGRYIEKLKNGDKITFTRNKNKVDFLRRKEYSFFKRITEKMKIGYTEN